MNVAVGNVTEIRRYPVKSFAGESLEEGRVESYGLHGDRFCAFYDETKQGWNSFITARQSPRMLAYQAKLVDEGIHVTSPDGRSFSWDDELLHEMQPLFKRTISMKSYRAENPVDPHLMSVDAASILIITDASLRKLEALWGKPLDSRRFRANLLVTLEEGMLPETEWLGKRLSIGSVELQVDEACSRCAIITMDPDTQERDPSLTRIVNEHLGLNFGVYASVKKEGLIRLGDKVYM